MVEKTNIENVKNKLIPYVKYCDFHMLNVSIYNRLRTYMILLWRNQGNCWLTKPYFTDIAATYPTAAQSQRVGISRKNT